MNTLSERNHFLYRALIEIENTANLQYSFRGGFAVRLSAIRETALKAMKHDDECKPRKKEENE